MTRSLAAFGVATSGLLLLSIGFSMWRNAHDPMGFRGYTLGYRMQMYGFGVLGVGSIVVAVWVLLTAR